MSSYWLAVAVAADVVACRSGRPASMPRARTTRLPLPGSPADASLGVVISVLGGVAFGSTRGVKAAAPHSF